MLNPSFRSLASAFLFTAISISSAQTASPKPAAPVLAAWTELVGDEHTAPHPHPTGHTVVRVITSAKSCPSAQADGRPLLLAVREAATASFPVTTCQGTPPTHARHIAVAGISLQTKPERLQRIIVIGDTGCRLAPTLLPQLAPTGKE
jgi:hypothetical protein